MGKEKATITMRNNEICFVCKFTINISSFDNSCFKNYFYDNLKLFSE